MCVEDRWEHFLSVRLSLFFIPINTQNRPLCYCAIESIDAYKEIYMEHSTMTAEQAAKDILTNCGDALSYFAVTALEQV